MKKQLVILLMACVFLLSGCSGQEPQAPAANNAGTQAASPADSGDLELIEIKEKLFVAQTNDFYLNTEDYLGKTIKYEGIFNSFTSAATGVTYCSVIRYGPGCCGDDGNVGFEVSWNGDYPAQNDWVEVVGILETYEEDGWEYLWLRLSSLTVLPLRGAELVSQ